MPLSSAQVTKLGDRLRSGALETGDDELLAEFLLSFRDFAKNTFLSIIAQLIDARDQIDPLRTLTAERSIKSSQSITEKLRRQPSLRLDQIQDIVGCRIIVTNTQAQDEVARLITARFPSHDLKDRRALPTFGYRAIHLIIRDEGHRYEVQIRTRIQHIWASIVESLIALYGIDIKYGGGPVEVQNRLQNLSLLIARHEARPYEVSLIDEIDDNIDQFEHLIGDSQ